MGWSPFLFLIAIAVVALVLSEVVPWLLSVLDPDPTDDPQP